MKRKILFVLPAVLLVLKAAYADESDVKISPSASVYYQIGQLEKTFDPSQTWPNKTWDQRCDVRLSLNATVQDHLRIVASAEAAIVTQVQPPRGGSTNGTTSTTSYAFPREGQGIYTFGDDPEKFPLQLALGYFPFKYNPQASNMGEYLFRTGTYPPFVINDFDDCEARLLGLRATGNLFGALTGTAVATTIGKGMVDLNFVTMSTILAALLGAIIWNLLTWWLGLPSSSSHALVGALCGATLANAGGNWKVIHWAVENPLSHKSHELLHTKYTARPLYVR